MSLESSSLRTRQKKRKIKKSKFQKTWRSDKSKYSEDHVSKNTKGLLVFVIPYSQGLLSGYSIFAYFAGFSIKFDHLWFNELHIEASKHVLAYDWLLQRQQHNKISKCEVFGAWWLFRNRVKPKLLRYLALRLII